MKNTQHRTALRSLALLLALAIIASSGLSQTARKPASPKKPTATTQTKPSGSTVTKVDHPKHHEPGDTVGVVNGTVITYADFNSMMSGYLKLFVKRSGNNIVTDSLYSVIVDSAWENAVEDILVEQTIQKEHLGLTDSEAIEMIVQHPPDFLAAQVTDAQGVIHRVGLRRALTDPRNDSVTRIVVQGERLRLEQEKFIAWVAPGAQNEEARRSAYAAWMRKAKSRAHIEDKRLAFGFY
jgi:hypothetical protein